jgi:hypothetical protein
MNKIISFLFISVFFLLNSAYVFSQDENNYDAVYLQLKKEYTLNPDGSMDYRYLKKLKLQTYRSFNSLYGETFIPYNPTFQTLKINEAYTIMTDGSKNPSPANAFNEVLPAFAANAPAYNNLREMVVTHSGTERNAIINLDYELHSNKGFYPCLMGNEVLAEVEPVEEMMVIIRVPIDKKLIFSVLNSSVTPQITKDGNFQLYTWVFTNVPAITTEDFQKGGNDLTPRLIFSSEKDRLGLYKEFQKQPAFFYAVNEEMKNAVALFIDNKDKTDVALKLQDKVINEFRLYPVPMKYTGFTPRIPQETWNSNGGTLVEKALLLTALLKEAGLVANPVFMIRNNLYDEAIGSLMDIEDVLVKAELAGTGPVYLSLSNLNPQNLFYCDPERVFVELEQGDIKIEKSPLFKNKVSLNGSFTISEDKQLMGEISFSGDNGTNPYLMLFRDKSKAKSLIGGGLSSGDLKDPSIPKMGIDQSSVVMAVQKDKAFRTDSGYFFFQLPLLTNGIESLGIHLLPKDRITPLEISSQIEENETFKIILSNNMKPFLPNEKKEIKNETGTFSFEVKTQGKKVLIHKSLNLEKKLIQPAEYPDFKALMDHWNADRYREVIFVN